MRARTIALLLSPFLASSACGGPPAPAADTKTEVEAKREAEEKARIESRKQERLAKEEAEKKRLEEIAVKTKEITVIPEGTKLPKKLGDACEQLVKAQEGFMKKFHPQVPEAALTTQLGKLRQQCNEMKDIKVTICQKYALDATTELLKGAINEYLPACMEKYGSKAG